MKRHEGKMTLDVMIDILRSHEEEHQLPPLHHFSVKSVCMHAGFFYGDHTTGSYCITLKKGEPLIGFATGNPRHASARSNRSHCLRRRFRTFGKKVTNGRSITG